MFMYLHTRLGSHVIFPIILPQQAVNGRRRAGRGPVQRLRFTWWCSLDGTWNKMFMWCYSVVKLHIKTASAPDFINQCRKQLRLMMLYWLILVPYSYRYPECRHEGFCSFSGSLHVILSKMGLIKPWSCSVSDSPVYILRYVGLYDEYLVNHSAISIHPFAILLILSRVVGEGRGQSQYPGQVTGLSQGWQLWYIQNKKKKFLKSFGCGCCCTSLG